MDSLFEFMKWCFKDTQSGFATIIVIYLMYTGIIGIIHAIKGMDPKPDAPDDD